MDPTADNHFLAMQSMTVMAAFIYNGHILGITCSLAPGFHVHALACNLPPAMAPTLKQQIVPHKTYIDTLPWPSLRDRILNSPSALNEQEFLTDVASLKVWGAMPWDPMAWEVGPEVCLASL